MKKKNITLDEAAEKLTKIVYDKHLASLPTGERKGRIRSLHGFVKDIAIVSEEHGNLSKPQEPDCIVQIPLAARKRR
jgi:hypothetical protein